MIPVEEILEALDLSRAEPGTGFLEALFARFNAKVSFENASKIVRNAEVADLRAKPRTPEIFWEDHLASGMGGTCFARVAAFDVLLSALGFRTRKAVGKVLRDHDHAALMVETAGGDWIVDVGFPLPAVLPARPASCATSQGEISVEPTARGFQIRLCEGVPEGPRSFEIYSAPVAEDRFADLWRETFGPDARFLKDVSLRRDLGNRVLSYAAGEVRVDDLHSRLRVPLSGSRQGLADLFGIDAAVLERAFELSGVPEGAAGREATLAAYLEVEATPAEAFEPIASPEGYGRLLAGVAGVAAGLKTKEGFRLTFSSPEGAPEDDVVEEEVTVDAGARRLAILRRRSGSSQASSYRAQERDGKTYLVREATFPGKGEDLLRNDSLRGRLAGTLAVDLLAWARML